MNAENLVIESQETQPSSDFNVEPLAEVTPLAPDFWMLVGGGGGIVLD
ncbi:MAG TPA: hypothetical protein VH278_16935 [Burkholderiaceae bacterium]|jgi:hypothetical protein|nr:hypothetical protein [Burkholderiaceae bacterium]